MPSAKHILAFLCASLLLSGLIYQDAMWGKSLLAPLDLGPDLFSHYKFMDPGADGIPENHHIIDQFTYDLPLQAAIHKAYQQGEIPWWDPYTYGGRPLLGDAHVNGTDPIRLLCYRLLPFELAYNWNYITRGIITGLGMFLLLSYLGVRTAPAAILAIAYQFAGWYTLFFGHPWVQGSFVYFPYLWILWLRASQDKFALNTALAGLACGFVFYSGNLQSHSYLPLFAIAFLTATFLSDPRTFARAMGTCTFSGIIGMLLAFPVLANQIEFYLLSLRPVAPGTSWFSNLMSLPLALFSIYPWSIGTFRTLDATKVIGGNGITFTLFFGAVASFLALLGALRCRRTTGMSGIAGRQALILVVLYLAIMASPLSAIFYSRSSGLAGMGLAVLAGLAIRDFWEERITPSKAVIRLFAGFVVAVALGTSCLAWMVYPRFKPAIERKLTSGEPQTTYSAIPSIAKMRIYQIASFPREVSLQNPEAALTMLATLVFAFAMIRQMEHSKRKKLVLAALCLSALPVLMFHARFRPKQPIVLWQRMLAGGEAQQEALRVGMGGRRLDETALPLSEMIFPNAMGTLYGMHCVTGYSALQPTSILRYPQDAPPLAEEWRADLRASDSTILASVSKAEKTGSSRFRKATDGGPANVSITGETFNTLTLDVSRHDQSQSLIRTDTYYPGWHAVPDTWIGKLDPCFSKIGPLAAGSDHALKLQYTPSMFRFYGPAIGLGTGFILLLMAFNFTFHRKPVRAAHCCR